MTDLTTWLRAQLDDDEQKIVEHPVLDRPYGGPSDHYEATILDDLYSILTVNARFALAEVDAKRRILQQAWTGIEDLAVNIESARGGDDCGARELRDEIVKLLALPFADRPGYRQEWRP